MSSVTINIDRELLALITRELTGRQHHLRHRIKTKDLSTGARLSEYRKHDEIERFKKIVKTQTEEES